MADQESNPISVDPSTEISRGAYDVRAKAARNVTPQESNPDEYNGWTNRETWAVNLHLTNDEALYNEARKIADGDEYGQALESWVGSMADDVFDRTHLPAIGRENKDDEILMMVKEIGSLWRVNWREVRDSLVEE